MNEIRFNNLKKPFEGVCLDSTAMYTNQEIVDGFQAIQQCMKEGIFEKVHAGHMRDKDVLGHILSLAEEYGLKDTKVYRRFEINMTELGYIIKTYIRGFQGERAIRRILKLLSYDRNVKILYNVALEDEDAQTEYDVIVITPYGVFVVEVKNWGAEVYIDENGILKRDDRDIAYDLPGRMGIKEALLREYLGELFPDRYQSLLYMANEYAKVREDNYKQIPVCSGGGIVQMIRSFNDGVEILTKEQIEQIVNRITSNQKEQKTLCPVNCEELIEDYALLMVAIEEAAEGRFDSVEELQKMGSNKLVLKSEPEEKVLEIPEYLIVNEQEQGLGSSKWLPSVAALLVIFCAGLVTGHMVGLYK